MQPQQRLDQAQGQFKDKTMEKPHSQEQQGER
jgi:hypothetical protein